MVIVLIGAFALVFCAGYWFERLHFAFAAHAMAADNDFGAACRKKLLKSLNDDELSIVAKALTAEMQTRPALADAWELVLPDDGEVSA